MPVCQNFRHLKSTVEKSCCLRTNTIGRIRMHLLGTKKRFSIDFHHNSCSEWSRGMREDIDGQTEKAAVSGRGGVKTG